MKGCVCGSSTFGFLCTGFLGFNFKPAKGGGGGSSSLPLEACVCNFFGRKIAYEYNQEMCLVACVSVCLKEW